MVKLIGNLSLPAAAIAMLCFATYHVAENARESPRREPRIEPARTPVPDSVAGSGLVEAKAENVLVGSALPGVILEVYVPGVALRRLFA